MFALLTLYCLFKVVEFFYITWIAYLKNRHFCGLKFYPTQTTLQADKVFSKHALIEYHPLTRSFWLRDLQTSQQGGVVGHTTRNNRPIYGMVNLRNGDSIRFGKSVEHVFEMMPAIVQKTTDKVSLITTMYCIFYVTINIFSHTLVVIDVKPLHRRLTVPRIETATLHCRSWAIALFQRIIESVLFVPPL
jgi:hypothetical protein